MRQDTRPKAKPGQDGPRPATIGEFLEYLSPGWHETGVPPWPPDVFALAAMLLQKSGAYGYVSEGWPPTTHWVKEMRRVGHDWRRSWGGKERHCPLNWVNGGKRL